MQVGAWFPHPCLQVKGPGSGGSRAEACRSSKSLSGPQKLRRQGRDLSHLSGLGTDTGRPGPPGKHQALIPAPPPAPGRSDGHLGKPWQRCVPGGSAAQAAPRPRPQSHPGRGRPSQTPLLPSQRGTGAPCLGKRLQSGSCFPSCECSGLGRLLTRPPETSADTGRRLGLVRPLGRLGPNLGNRPAPAVRSAPHAPWTGSPRPREARIPGSAASCPSGDGSESGGLL